MSRFPLGIPKSIIFGLQITEPVSSVSLSRWKSKQMHYESKSWKCYKRRLHVKKQIHIINIVMPSVRRKEMFCLTTHSTHFIYGYMASDIWLRTILIVRKETRCRNICYSFRLTARVLLYARSHRQDSTYHDLCYTSRVALAGTRNSSVGSPYEGSTRRPIAPCANALTTELRLAPPSVSSSLIAWSSDLSLIFCIKDSIP